MLPTNKNLGLNAINLIMKGETLAPEKNKNYTLTIGDSFTLCGQHFPFQLVTMDDSIPVPRPPEVRTFSEISKQKFHFI